MAVSIQKRLRPPVLIDLSLVALTLILVSFSLVMVYSTTGVVSQEKFHDALYYVKRQMFAAFAGVVLMFICAHLNVDFLKRISPYFFFVSFTLVLLTLLPGIGESAGGARRWIRLPFIRFQPSELIKVTFVLFLAGFLSRHEQNLHKFTEGIMKPFAMMGMIGVLLLKQPDFGSTAVIALVTLAMCAAAGARIRHLIFCVIALGICVVVLVKISPYRMQRIVTFLSPWNDASGKGYQLIQSLIAVGSGQWTGVGLGESQQKLFFLPAAHTDFIFAVIGEELGFVGCTALLCMFLLFLCRGLFLAGKLTSNTFAFSLAVGLTMLIVVPALLNTGVVTGLLPTKGMVLPLVGYGGSSLVASLISIGILLSLARSQQKGLI